MSLTLVNSFQQLDPPIILSAAEQAGFLPTGQFWQLNSYENRVFDLALEKPIEQLVKSNFAGKSDRVIAKFYRSGRWSYDCLSEEHQFLFDLQKEGIPAVAPLILNNGHSLMKVGGLWVAFFPKQMGKMPDELLENDFYQIGRRLAQLHNVGSQKEFIHRPILSQTPFHMWENLSVLSEWVAPEVWPRYEQTAIHIIETLEHEWANTQNFIRIHGDVHRGNILLNPPSEYFFVDFDDCCMGPEIQDFWMLFSDWKSNKVNFNSDSNLNLNTGSDPKSDSNKGFESSDSFKSDLNDFFQNAEAELILKGYSELRRPPLEQFRWIPLLRGLRLQSFAAWIARRWDDPSFPRIFPHFNTYNYWASETDNLWQCWKDFHS